MSFEVVEGNYPPILNLEPSVDFNIVQRVGNVTSIMIEDADAFKGIGCIKGEHTIWLDITVAHYKTFVIFTITSGN